MCTCRHCSPCHIKHLIHLPPCYASQGLDKLVSYCIHKVQHTGSSARFGNNSRLASMYLLASASGSLPSLASKEDRQPWDAYSMTMARKGLWKNTSLNLNNKRTCPITGHEVQHTPKASIAYIAQRLPQQLTPAAYASNIMLKAPDHCYSMVRSSRRHAS